MLSSKVKSSSKNDPLEVLTATMVALQMKAKLFHLNVTGPRFYGDHKTYDGIYAVADEWFDTLAERMRTLEEPVCVCPEWVMTLGLLDSVGANEGSTAEEMIRSMLSILETISDYINDNLDDFDPTTVSIVQDLDAELGRQVYFIRSSI